jgi:hypothetical protein
VICCLWSGTGDVVVAKKRRETEKERQQWQRRERESNVKREKDLCLVFFFNRWITYVSRVANLDKNGR